MKIRICNSLIDFVLVILQQYFILSITNMTITNTKGSMFWGKLHARFPFYIDSFLFLNKT